METARIVRIFVSSPGDVAAERRALQQVVETVNQTQARHHEVRFELHRWEDGVPQIGPSPQRVVDAQTPHYEVYLGIMWGRFGTPTDGHGSGTEDEFRQALTRWASSGSPWILFYFRDDPPLIRTADESKQYARVFEFREELQQRGVIGTYQGVADGESSFVRKVDEHLRLLLVNHFAPAGPRPRESAARKKGPRQPSEVPPGYRQWLRKECSDVEVLGLRLKEGQAVRLTNVYVPLVTDLGSAAAEERARSASRRSFRPQLLLERLGDESVFVPGDPGSGKSTFCRWVAWLALEGAVPQHGVAAPGHYAESFPASLQGKRPLLVRLRELWTYLPRDSPRTVMSLARLEQTLGRWIADTQNERLTWDVVHDWLGSGSALMLIDGLDEVPLESGAGRQSWHPRSLLLSGLAEAVPVWSRSGNRIMVTSRPYLQTNEIARLGLPVAPIHDLDDQLQTLLVRRWFRALDSDADRAESTAVEMLAHVSGRSELEGLRANPLFLTAMAIVFGEGKRLPEDQYELFNRVVDAVLHSRYRESPARIPVIRGRLAVVAHGMHTGAGIGETRGTPQAEATFDEVERMIRAYQETSAATEEGFTGALDAREELLSRSGLLVQRGNDRAAFYHLSLQDFFAAGRQLGLSRGALAGIFRQRALRPEWHGALRFLFGALLASNELPDEAVEMLGGLLRSVTDEELGLQTVLASCIDILIRRRLRLQPDLEERFRSLAVSAINREVDVRSRLQLALTLGRIGDHRIVDDLKDRGAYVEIAAGDYRIAGEEGGRKTVSFAKPFWMSRYPVTNSQYARFVQEGGYVAPDRCWSPSGRRWLEQHRHTEPGFWKDGRYNAPSQPVVGVSLWEAEAFACWVGGRLPTGDEWEAAAGGPQSFVYPWGNEWREGICNTGELRLERPTPVGMFPASRSPFGLDDAAGNVTEWTSTITQHGKEKGRGTHQSRGGCYAFSRSDTECSHRGWDFSDIRSYIKGFRVVIDG